MAPVGFSIVLPVKQKKPNHLYLRQLGYLLRPVAFRPYLSTGLALSQVIQVDLSIR